MASQADICNVALTILGATRINAISDQTEPAKVMNALWNLERDSELRKHIWKFSLKRASLPALATVPVSGPYTQQFGLPADFLRLISVNDQSYPAVDLSDYRSGATTDDWSLEGNLLLSNLNPPVAIKYISQVTDTTQWDSAFCDAFAARLAYRGCYKITQSLNQQKVAIGEYQTALMSAVRAGALETTPTVLGDDTWVATRPVGSGGAAWLRYG